MRAYALCVISCFPFQSTHWCLAQIFGSLNNTAGRVVQGNVGAGCADPKFPEGCLFWHEYASNTKHFIRSCSTPPCGFNACQDFVNVGAGVLSMHTGTVFMSMFMLGLHVLIHGWVLVCVATGIRPLDLVHVKW